MGRTNTYWVEFEFEYDILYDGEWVHESDFDSGRIKCTKKEIKEKVREHIEEQLQYEPQHKNLKITITDQYITSDEEL